MRGGRSSERDILMEDGKGRRKKARFFQFFPDAILGISASTAVAHCLEIPRYDFLNMILTHGRK